VTSLVNDVLLPPLGLVLGRVDFSNLFLALGPGSYNTLAEAKKAGVPVLAYGAFFSSIMDFGIIALSIFMILRWLEKFRLLPSSMGGVEDPAPTRSEKLLEEIRNELRGRTGR
ncbi:MAG: large conductance mechanosensitive channel protein MscL, partial [Verrucomicrobia bacterium]|nr:large conductance mechanosensitive channel protein MscL [Verrucomicrobiota bacterium]